MESIKLVLLCYIFVSCYVKVGWSADTVSSQVQQTLKYLKRYGYVDPGFNKRDGKDLSVDDLANDIMQLQKYAGLKDATGKLTPETLKLMGTPRCGVPDPIGDSTGELDHRRIKRYKTMGSRWKHNNLTYIMINYSDDLDEKTTDKVIRKAFDMWSENSPLTFERVYSGDADIRIKFGSYKHGDPYGFDGKGGTLAHAFGPGSNTHGINGDLDFDDSETFTDKSYKGTNLLFTAVHELGHSLGLSHSDIRGAIMYPWYLGYVKDLHLQPDDIAGIQAIYGTKENPKTVVPPTTEVPEWTPPPTWSDQDSANFPWPNDSKCDIPFRAIANIRNDIFAFETNSFWRWGMSFNGKRPLLMSSVATARMYRGAPDDIDAAYYNSKTDTMRIFKDGQYWEFIRHRSANNPRPVSTLGRRLPSKIDAAVYSIREDKTYIFRDENVWRYNEETKRVDNGYPKPISVEFPGIGDKVDIAFRDDEDSVYFVTNRVLRRFSLSYRRVLEEPVFFAETFLSCTRT